MLAGEEVFPVASPAFVKARQGRSDPASFVGERLIHLEEPYIPVLTWSEWFRQMNVDYLDDGKGLRCNDYTPAMHAAVAGEGIALGWGHVVEGLMKMGLLVRVGERTVSRMGQGCYLVWSSDVPLSPQAMAVRDWFMEAAALQGRPTGP